MAAYVDWSVFKPAAQWGRQVNRKTLRADLFAGLTNATVVLPQGVAFAAIAGLPPEYGIYTAMIPPIIAALFGSSMVMISGPTTAISAVVFGAFNGVFTPGSPEFIQHVLLMTVLVGLIQLALGLARVGRLVAFVSYSVMVGFTAAAAVLIGISQLDDALGLEIEAGGAVVERLWHTLAALPQTEPASVLIAATALGVAVGVRMISIKLPNFIIALGAASLLGWLLGAQERGIDTVGALPSIVPALTVPSFRTDTLGITAEAAFAVALIGLLEAVSIGRAFAMKTGRTFDANREIVGQGLSNTVGGFFQAYPASGSFTRSGVNYEAGARTPMAAIFSSVFLLLLLVFMAPLLAHIPIPALAGIILLVAWKLVHKAEIVSIVKRSRSETAILAATFLAGIVVGLEFSIYVGVILSLLIFLNKTARPALAVSAPRKGVFLNAQTHHLPECPQAVFVRLDGPLYFGSAAAVDQAFRALSEERPGQKFLILILKGVGDIDLSGGMAIMEEAARRKRAGGALFIVARYPPLIRRLLKLNVIQTIGRDHLFARKGDVIQHVLDKMEDDICAKCTARVFAECATKPGAQEAQVHDMVK